MIEYIQSEIMEPFSEIPIPFLILIIVSLMAQSTWLFMDAKKHNKYPWLWGVWGLVQFPMPLLLYLIFVRKIYRRIYRRKKEDNYE